MKPIFKPLTFPKFNRKAKYIIIHDNHCTLDGFNEISSKSAKCLVNKARGFNWITNHQTDLNCHMVVQVIENIPETILARPLHRKCVYEDIPSQYDYAFHIMLLGDYEILLPDQDFYNQIAYRAIAPFLMWFKMSVPQILLHSEVTTSDINKNCPGSLFDKNKLLGALQSMKAV